MHGETQHPLWINECGQLICPVCRHAFGSRPTQEEIDVNTEWVSRGGYAVKHPYLKAAMDHHNTEHGMSW